MEIVSSVEMKEIEEVVFSHYALTPELLMEHAGLSMAEFIGQYAKNHRFSCINILCGKGHNGGDGYVIARILHNRGFHVSTYSPQGTLKPLTELNQRRCHLQGIPLKSLSELSPQKDMLIVDALFGIGLNRPLDNEIWGQFFSSIEESKATVIAVDAPSGLFISAKGALLNAHITLTVERPKLEFYTPETRNACGRIFPLSAQFPQEVFQRAATKLFYPSTTLNATDLFSYKNKKGHVALWGGSENYPGAALLASQAALKSGCGLLTLFTNSKVAQEILKAEPSLILGKEGEAYPFEAWGCGCGWGLEATHLETLKQFVKTPIPRVIDADGLKLLRQLPQPLVFAEGAVLTPHPGEWRSLCPESSGNFHQDLQTFAREKKVTVVYKSSFTVVVSPQGELKILDNPLPQLGVAGSGDVLTGIILHFLTKYKDPTEAAIKAVALHNGIGGRCAETRGRFTPFELVQELAASGKHPPQEKYCERNL